jgi:hypothetical protein
MTISLNISHELMTFLTANYGLTEAQILSYAEAYNAAYWSMAGEIEYTWQEGGFYPEDPECAMIECLCDADRLRDYMAADEYDAWCMDFLYKMELVYDLMGKEPPGYLQEYLLSSGMTWYRATAA